MKGDGFVDTQVRELDQARTGINQLEQQMPFMYFSCYFCQPDSESTITENCSFKGEKENSEAKSFVEWLPETD